MALISALGGTTNLLEIDACTTRLRLRIVDYDRVNEPALKALGAAGVLHPTRDTVQVVIGLRADEIASNMRAVAGGAAACEAPGAQAAEVVPRTVGMEMSAALAPVLLTALGGENNVVTVEAFGTRLSLLLKDAASVDEEKLRKNGFRGLADLGGGRIQVIAEGDVGGLAAVLNRIAG
jgi:PTS system N-acetylglucosamine-specific IIC component